MANDSKAGGGGRGPGRVAAICKAVRVRRGHAVRSGRVNLASLSHVSEAISHAINNQAYEADIAARLRAVLALASDTDTCCCAEKRDSHTNVLLSHPAKGR